MFSTKRGVAALSIASNSTLVALKLVAGLSIGSVSVISEAIHSSVDLLASVMAFFAVRASAKPPDDEHLFGHGKAESLSGAAEALLIFLAALMIINEAVQKLLYGVHLENVDVGIAVMGLSSIANIIVSRRLMRVAKATDSMALEADAWHLTTDVLTSAGVAAGLVAVRLTGLDLLDPIIAIGVALFIFKAAYDITRRSIRDLLDTSLPEEEQAIIREVLDKHSGRMVGYHQIRSRKSGSERHVDLHLVMNRNVTVQQSHDLCDHLEADLREELGDVVLNIHVEPCEPGCELCESGCAPERTTSEAPDPRR
ncbi:MAG TPA: cation diffusion facilitator family transporter [Chloroflexota bacterium]